jgi:hypothetical protein
MKLAERVFLVDDMMEGLMAKDHIHRPVLKPEMASCSVLKLYGKAVTQSLRAGSGDHSRVNVDRYQALLGPEAIMQQFQGKTPPTAYIHNHRVRRAPVRD